MDMELNKIISKQKNIMKNQQNKEIHMHYLIFVFYMKMDMELSKIIQKRIYLIISIYYSILPKMELDYTKMHS